MNIFDEPGRRDKQLNMQLTADEKKRLEEAADRAKLTVSDYIRKAVNEMARREEKRKK